MSIYDKLNLRKNSEISVMYTSGYMRRGRIEIIAGPGKGTSITIDSLTPVSVGRQSKKCSLVISSMSVSRVHCIIEFDDSKRVFSVTDCSANGTFFNGNRLPHNKAVIFKTGTVLSLANENYKIVLI